MPDENDAIKVSVKLNIKDVQNYSLYFNRRSFILTESVFLAFALYMLFFNREFLATSNMLVVFFAGTVVFGIVCIFLQQLIIKARTQLSFKTYDFTGNQQHYSIGPDGMMISNSSGAGLFPWEQLHRVEETKDSFYIYTSQAQSSIIPKRCFANEAEIAKFKQTVRGKLGPKQVKLK